MKYAICNELFGEMTFEATCQMIAKYGFQGIEIAPFTVFRDPKQVRSTTIREIRNALRQTGVQFAGFHWLFLSPEGLHITSPDSIIRERSWDHLRRLIDIAGELGGGGLILGSPKQRHVTGISHEQGIKYLRQGLAKIAVHAEERNSRVLIEALPAEHTNIINTLEEARRLIRDIDQAGVDGMFDFHNCADESLSWPELIETYFDIIRHVHLNENNGSYPGTGTSDFLTAFRMLRKKGYTGWVSLEIFDTDVDADIVLDQTRTFLQMMNDHG
jgi:sugar phosphate isomerase/epimerase